MFAELTKTSDRVKANSAFLSEFSDLLARYGFTDDVGLALIHDHPQIAEDEIAIETPLNDHQLVLTGTPRHMVGDDVVETVWRVSSGNLVCVQGCGGCKV